jgi:hypothetical protein
LISKTDMAGLAPVSLLLAAILVSGCQKDGAKIAEVDDRAILASDLEKYAGRELSVQRENLYKSSMNTLAPFC